MDLTAVPTAAGRSVIYREATPADFDFVQGTLLNHYCEESFWAQRLTTRVFFDGHTPLVRALLEQAKVAVACDSEDPTLLFGFIVFEPGGGPDGRDVLDFVYVKKSFRRLGIGTRLLGLTGYPETLKGVCVTFCTKAWFRTKQQRGLEERYEATYWPYGQWRAFNPQ